MTFAITAVQLLAALLDAASTYVGVHWLNAIEMNEHVLDHSALGLLLHGWPLVLAVVVISAISEAFAARGIQAASSYSQFQHSSGDHGHRLAWYVLVWCLAVGMTRFCAAAGNASYIFFGVNPIVSTSGWLSGAAHAPVGTGLAVIYGLLGGILTVPASRCVFYVARFQTRAPNFAA